MNFVVLILTSTWLRISAAALVPALLLNALFLANAYLNRASQSRAVWILEREGIPVSINQAIASAEQDQLYRLDMLHIAGVDMGQKGDSGQTPLMAALRNYSSLSADWLIRRFEVERTLQIQSGDTGVTAFEEAVRSGDFQMADRIRRVVNELNQREISSVGEILKQGQDFPGNSKFSFLFHLGINPLTESARERRHLPFLLAMEREDDARLRQLIRQGADFSFVRPDGNSVFAGAILDGKHDLVIDLIRAGATLNPKLAPPGEKTPLEAAIQSGDMRMVNLLLDCHANPNQVQSDGLLPLAAAIRERDAPLVKALASRGADLSDSSLVFGALENGDLASFSALLDAGVSPNTLNTTGTRLLDQALIDDHAECALSLIRHGADTQGGLAFALQSGDPELVDLLLSNGASLDELGGERGWAPLDFAFSTGNTDLAAVLFKHGAIPRSTGWNRITLRVLIDPDSGDPTADVSARKIILTVSW